MVAAIVQTRILKAQSLSCLHQLTPATLTSNCPTLITNFCTATTGVSAFNDLCRGETGNATARATLCANGADDDTCTGNWLPAYRLDEGVTRQIQMRIIRPRRRRYRGKVANFIKGVVNDDGLLLFVQFLKRNVQGGLQTKKAVMVSGQQQSGIFAMNSKCFLDSNGEEVAEVSNPHVWLKRESIMESDKIMMDDVTAVVRKPLSLSSAVDFFLNLKKCLNHNLIPGLLVVSGAVMSFHYRTVIDKYGGCA